jgi:hypothetical protein
MAPLASSSVKEAETLYLYWRLARPLLTSGVTSVEEAEALDD